MVALESIFASNDLIVREVEAANRPLLARTFIEKQTAYRTIDGALRSRSNDAQAQEIVRELAPRLRCRTARTMKT